MIGALASLAAPLLGRFAVPVALAGGLAAGAAGFALWDRLVDDPAVRAEARRGYVLETEKRAAEASLAEVRRQLSAARQVRDSYAAGLAEAAAREAARTEQIESEIADYERKLSAAGRDCRLSDADIEWLRQR